MRQTRREGSRQGSALHASNGATQERKAHEQAPFRVSNRVFIAIVVLELALASF
jgi:hypothetical protein